MELVDIREWSSFDDLLNKIKSISINQNSDEIPHEIERKWLVNQQIIYFLTAVKNISHKHTFITQGYLSVDPEIRYRTNKEMKENSEIEHFLSYKTDGELIREEYEFQITPESGKIFEGLINNDKNIKLYNGNKFIIKDYYEVYYADNIKFQISVVDNRRDFVYLEIEFPDADSANRYNFADDIQPFIIREVTSEKKYKMKNYWAQTRL